MQNHSTNRPLAVVTGASSGIGYQLACCAARAGFDLVVAADRPLEDAASALTALGAGVQTINVDLATLHGVDQLCELINGRAVEVLIANTGHGLGKGFLDQDFADVQHVIHTNITGTLYLLHRLTPSMVANGKGRILVTGSIAGFQPGAFQAAYNGSKAFIDSFAIALRNELGSTPVTVTCLMPGATDTEFFTRADMLDTKVGSDQDAKMDAAEVAEIGFEAMMNGQSDVVAGLKNKLTVVASKVLPSQVLAQQHRKLAEPGTANQA